MIKDLRLMNILSIGVIILLAVVMRLLPHPANVAPIAALALFGGVYLDKRFALIVPLVAMLISDFFLGFHASMPMVYISFVLTGLIGMWVRSNKSIPVVIGASLLSSTIFFLLTNFNYWYTAPLYAKTFSGVIESYINALPFFRNTILGDLVYTGLFFGAYELVQSVIHTRAKALVK